VVDVWLPWPAGNEEKAVEKIFLLSFIAGFRTLNPAYQTFMKEGNAPAQMAG